MGRGDLKLVDLYMPFILVMISYAIFVQIEEDRTVGIALPVVPLDLD